MSIAMKEIKPPVVVSSMIKVKERGLKRECGLWTDHIIPYRLSKHWLSLFPELLIFEYTQAGCCFFFVRNSEKGQLWNERNTAPRLGQQLVEEMLPTWNMTQRAAADSHGGWRVPTSAATANGGVGLMSSPVMADSLGGEWPKVITEK